MEDTKSQGFKSKFKSRERVWDWILTLTVASSTIGAGGAYVLFSESSLVENPIWFVFATAFSSLMCGWLCLQILLRPIDTLLRRTWLKGYWIEDCGDVIKLHGSVKLTDMNRAYRDLLAGHPEFRIASDSVGIYGCTLAAVKATEDEIVSKKELESLGFKASGASSIR